MRKRSLQHVGFIVAFASVAMLLGGCRQHSQVGPVGDAEQGFLLRDRLDGGKSVTHAISITTTVADHTGFGETSTTSADLITRAIAVRKDKRIHEAKLENVVSSEKDILADILGSAVLADLFGEMHETAFEMSHRCEVQEMKGQLGGAMLIGHYGPFGISVNTIVFPEDRVKFGDSWQAQVKLGGPVPQFGVQHGVDINDMMGLQDTVVTFTYTLVGQDFRNGKNCLYIVAETDGKSVQLFEPIKIWLDPETGHVEEFEATQMIHSHSSSGKAVVTILRKG